MVLDLLLIASLAASTSTASASAAETNDFTQLFAVTCMANAFSRDKLRTTLNTPLTPEFSPERAAKFLAGRSGTAWQVFYGEGQYAVVLTDSHCAVFAQKAPIAEVHAGFLAFVDKAPAPFEATKIALDEAGPNTEDLTSVGYLWSHPDDAVGIVFRLTTSKAARNPEVQAMATVGLVRREP